MEGNSEIKIVFWLGTFLFLFIGIALLVLVMFYKNYVAKMRQKEAELLLKTALETEKNERERIAADLHDGVSGDLNAVRNFIAILNKKEISKEDKNFYNIILEGIENALESTRNISYKLMPPLLHTMGFISAIKDYLERLTIQTSINYNTIINSDFSNLDANYSYELYRIIQELTTNQMKYGHLTYCQITLSEISENYIVTIEDDGIEFSFQDSLQTSKGSGLKNIQSRLKVLGASIQQEPKVLGNIYIISIKKLKT
jgi:signal transduction histidine kinase